MKALNDIRYPVPNKQGNSKAGVSIRLNQGEETEPFEVTIFLKKPEKETPRENAISITATGKLTLQIGERGLVEFFGENTRFLGEVESEPAAERLDFGEGETDEMHLL
jgi:hypothetical protein